MSKKILFIVLFLSFSLIQIYSQGIRPANPSSQANQIKRFLLFARNLPLSEKLKILIVYDEQSEKNKSKIEKAFNSEGVDIVSLQTSELVNYFEKVSAVYNVSNNKKIVTEFCINRKILSISGDPKDVYNGYASLSTGYEDINLRIIIKAGQLQKEGQTFSSESLNFAKIIR